VIARLGSGRRIRHTRSCGLTVTELPGFGSRPLGGALFLLLALPLALLQRRPFAFIAMQLSSTTTVASVAATIKRRRLLVLSTMSGDQGEVAFVRSSRVRALRRVLLKRASSLVAQTDEGAIELRSLETGRPVTVIPTPVELSTAAPPPLNGVPAAAFCGRLVLQKNVTTLVGAWLGVIAEQPDARLTLVGAGMPGDPTEAELRASIASSPGLKRSVSITGWRADVRPELEKADVYVFPSWFEGMSNALLEACALGRVVVASDIEANRAVLGDDYPLLFDPASVAECEWMLRRALDDASVREDARGRVLGRVELFDAELVLTQLEGLLRQTGTDRPPAERRPRVVFLAPGFSEPGGCASHARKIAEGLADLGWEVRVIARLGSGRRLLRARRPGLEVVEIPGFDRPRLGGLLFLLIAVPMVLFGRPPDTFMAMQLSSPATVASIGATFWRRRLLVFSTSTGDQGEVAFVRASRLARLRLALLGRATALIAQSEQGAGEMREVLPNSSVVVVPTPVALGRSLPPLNGNMVVAYTGRLVRGKNLEPLLEAWRPIAARIPEARLLLVGAGVPRDDTEATLRAMIAKDPALTRSVTVTGWVDDVRPYLESADTYVFPSAAEGMSNALLEACALGRVVVASDIAANRAVLGGEYELFVDPNDRTAFEHKLLSALSDNAERDRARAIILGRLGQFDTPVVLREIEALLRDHMAPTNGVP